MQPKINIKNIIKVFGKSPESAIHLLKQGYSKRDILKKTGCTIGVNNANLDIYEGEIFVVMGLSGSGKSTLIRMLNRLIPPTSGEILIDNENIVNMSPAELRETRRKKISMVFQNFALFPHKTILENTEYGLEIQNISEQERKEKAMESLEVVGLKGYENQYPSQLSGGMQQRVGLARALASDTDILLMDEAFSALDPLIRKSMQDELLEIQDKYKKTIVFITHDLDEALRIGDRIALMRDGRVMQVGTPEEIMMNPANDYVERFIEGIDLSNVLTAASIMTRAERITVDRGPRVALQIMKDRGYSNIFIVDRKQTLLGALSADQASEAILKQIPLEEVMTKEVPTAMEDTILSDLLDDMANAQMPIAIVDEANRLKGVLVRGVVIGALAGNKEILHDKEESQ